MRGWSLFYLPFRYLKIVCPAYAGMIPPLSLFHFLKLRLSRVCGDDPNSFCKDSILNKFVPRMRGWSYDSFYHRINQFVCPAYAGMILGKTEKFRKIRSLSRVCGDDPNTKVVKLKKAPFVPRMRGWSPFKHGRQKSTKVCPAYAGMIPCTIKSVVIDVRLSRVCGDDPTKRKNIV